MEPPPPPSPVEPAVNPNRLAVDDWVLANAEQGHFLAQIRAVEHWPTVELREYDIEAQQGESVLWVIGGLCGMIGTALTFVPVEHITEVDAHHVRTIPVATLLQQLYDAFDEESDDEDGEDREEEDDLEPRRSKRARHGVERLGVK